MGGMIALTAAVLPDLFAARTWQNFAQCIITIHIGSGLTCSDLESLPRNSGRELDRSTVSGALNGKRRITKPLLAGLMDVGRLPAEYPAEVRSTWVRMATDAPSRAGVSVRFGRVSPRELGVHAAIQVDGAPGDRRR